MKKILLTSLIIALGLIVIGGAGVVYAGVRGMHADQITPWAGPRTSDVLVQQGGFTPGGMMGGYGYGNRPGGMMGAYGYENHYQGMMGEFGNGYGPGAMMFDRGFGNAGDVGPMHDSMV